MVFKLRWVGVDQLVAGQAKWREAQLITKLVQDKVNFSHSCTVEATAKSGKESYDHGVGVALHSIEWLNHWEFSLPLVELLNNCGQVGNQERSIFLAGLDSFVD